MESLFDPSALTSLAERLLHAARAAGADSADAVAMRSVSLSVEVRDGARYLVLPSNAGYGDVAEPMERIAR